jgi:hypothetical protein
VLRLSMLGPHGLFDAARSVDHALRALGSAILRSEAVLPHIEELVAHGSRLLARADAAGPALEPLLKAAPKVWALLDRLDATLTPERTMAVGAALDAVYTRADVLPRALDRLDGLLASSRLERLGTLIDCLLDEDHDGIDRVARLLERVEQLLADDRVGRLLDRLDALLTDDNVRRIDGLLGAIRPDVAGRVLQRLDETLADHRAAALQGLLEQLPVLLSAERTGKLAALADQAPRLVDALENGNLPTSRELQQIPPDLHAMLELIDDLHQVVSGMPGATRARGRGDDPHPQV